MFQKVINFDYVTGENIKECILNWLQIPDHQYKILITADFGSEKTNSLFDLINMLPYTDKTYLHATDPYEAIYLFLINKWESTGLKHFIDSKAFIEYSNDVDDIHKNI